MGTFHLAFDTNAFPLSSTGDVVLVSPSIFNVVAPDSKEPIEDLLFPNVGSTSDVPSDIAFHVNERVGASTDGRKMIRITAGSMGVAIPSGQSDRAHVLAPGSIVSVDPPPELAYRSEVSVVVDEGAFLDMAGHETGLRFRPLVTKMCMLVYTESALQSADAYTSAGGRLTDDIICGCLLGKRSDIWNRSAPRGEYESLEEETTHQQFE